MISDAAMLRALKAEIEKSLRNSEAKLYSLSEKDFMGTIAAYLGDKNTADLSYLQKEFISLYNKLPTGRKLLLDNDRVATFKSKADADNFFRKTLRNVRRSTKDPIRQERYRESYINTASGRESSYRALYPQNYDISGAIGMLDEGLRHNPLAYGRIAKSAKGAQTGNTELDGIILDIARRVEQNQEAITILRRNIGGNGEITSSATLQAKVIGNKQNIRSQLKKMQEAIEDYTREDLVLSTREYLSEAITDILLKGKIPKTLKPKTTKVTSSGKQVVEIIKPKATITKNKTLRIGNSQADSVKVTSFINRAINSYVRRLMGTEGALVWRTGRFANSVKATRAILDSRTNAIYVYTQYMHYPYATFAKGGRQYTYERDPERLIARSVRALMRESFQSDWRLYVRNE